MTSALDLHYRDERLAPLYDLDSGWSRDRGFYLQLAQGPAPQHILDIGCGTGLLCLAYAKLGHQVTGADPAKAMLEIARSKDTQNRVHWVESSVQTLSLENTFDLIIMTGHAFQVLLNPDDRKACFQKVKEHLSPQGRFVFESRNPQFPWQDHWNYEMPLQLKEHTLLEVRQLRTWDGHVMTFDLHYHFPEQTLTSHSTLCFADLPTLKQELRASGLAVHALLGDWNGEAFAPDASQEMIFDVGHGTS